jgi:hypothetical protein
MGGRAMTRYPAIIAIAVLVGLPLWTTPSLAVILVGAIAGLFCFAGVLRLWLPSITIGGSLAVINYALALSLSAGGVDIVGAAAFGVALVFLLDLIAFARSFRGAAIADAVRRTQIAFWVGRAAVTAAAVALLTSSAVIFAYPIPLIGRPIIAGLGAAIAFAGAMRGGIVRDRDAP